MTVPYVIGQWVRGERFYGRGALIEDVLRGGRPCAWVAGARRIGKTSLLRQLELLAPEASLEPVVWDLQGVEDGRELCLSLADAVLDACGRDRLGPPAPGEDAPAYLARLARSQVPAGRALLLLCDEAEDLAALLGRERALADRLLDVLATAGVRVVLASSVRLAAVATVSPHGAALLARLGPPLYLGPLDPAASRALVRQQHLPAADRPALSDAAVEAICERCGGHPFLLQLLARRVLEGGELESACASLASDPMLAYLVAADLALLEEGDRVLLRRLPVTAGGAEPARAARLEALGLARRDAAGRLVGGNWIFETAFRLKS
ncbi:MAG TPA: hypothetical protein P5234_10080 [Thermoanaerobaculaceae bacterium]|nr:hypothetical protein [Thermoanaerobaculaceae bacterium]HRS16576.1 hypothetical protein [Thermoanaerobaculaceae bacterium]